MTSPTSFSLIGTLQPLNMSSATDRTAVCSPCGVGFSYGTSPGDNRHNDNSTAINTYVFMQQFYELYPQFSSNPFWITGESYGGQCSSFRVDQVLTDILILQESTFPPWLTKYSPTTHRRNLQPTFEREA